MIENIPSLIELKWIRNYREWRCCYSLHVDVHRVIYEEHTYINVWNLYSPSTSIIKRKFCIVLYRVSCVIATIFLFLLWFPKWLLVQSWCWLILQLLSQNWKNNDFACQCVFVQAKNILSVIWRNIININLHFKHTHTPELFRENATAANKSVWWNERNNQVIMKILHIRANIKM